MSEILGQKFDQKIIVRLKREFQKIGHLVVGLGGRGIVLVHEHGDADDDEQHEEVLEDGVPLAAEQDAKDHHGDGLARLADHLEKIMNVMYNFRRKNVDVVSK
jgi:hypothetical protein